MKTMIRFSLPVLTGLVLAVTLVGCQLPHAPMQTAAQQRPRLFGWFPLKKTDRTPPSEIAQIGSDEMAGSQEMEFVDDSTGTVVTRSPDRAASVTNGLSWSKWLDHLPKPPRIRLPRTDLGGNEIAVREPDDLPSGDGGF